MGELGALIRLAPGIAILVLLAMFLRANDKAHDWKMIADARQQLIDNLHEQGKQKQTEVKTVILKGKDRIITLQKEVVKIEEAPLPGDCHTPKEVMEADI